MDFFDFSDIQKEITSYQFKKEFQLTDKAKRQWQDLQEMKWCEHLCIYLNNKFGFSYDKVGKDKKLENQKIDAILCSSSCGDQLNIQLTRAGNEYDMNPNVILKSIDSSGSPIEYAISEKIKNFQGRCINSKEIILLIQGIIVGTKNGGFADDLIKNLCSKYQNNQFFKAIYYLSYENNIPYIIPLKESIKNKATN